MADKGRKLRSGETRVECDGCGEPFYARWTEGYNVETDCPNCGKTKLVVG